MAHSQDEKFKNLQAKWYDKLKKDGFDDIESPKDEQYLRVWHSSYFQTKYNAETFQDKSDYYRLASLLLHKFPFESEMQRDVWEFHCQGQSLRMIAKEYKTKICRIHKIVKEIARYVGRYLDEEE